MKLFVHEIELFKHLAARHKAKAREIGDLLHLIILPSVSLPLSALGADVLRIRDAAASTLNHLGATRLGFGSHHANTRMHIDRLNQGADALGMDHRVRFSRLATIVTSGNRALR